MPDAYFQQGSTMTMNARRQYRSVAFGTWKVGGARNLTERRSEEPMSRLKCSSPELHHLSTAAASSTISPITGSSTLGPSGLLSVDKRHSRLGESSPNLSRIHHTHTQLSLGLPNKMNHTNDFFSSTEYCQYVSSRDDINSFNGNSTGKSTEPIQAAFLRKSRKDGGGLLHLDDVSTSHHHHQQSKSARNLKYSQSSRRKYEQTNSGSSTDDSDRGSGTSAHHRSHSAGPHTTYSTTSTHAISTTEMNRSGVMPRGGAGSNGESNTTFLRATKRFFKKIYTSATLPKKQNSTSVDNFQKSSVFFDDENHQMHHNQIERMQKKAPLSSDENYYSNHLDDDYDDEFQTMRSENATMDISYPDSGFEMDRASTPEQSSVSMTSTSKSGDEPVNFNNLFEQLKREMKEMRERDAQILADLQRVETQIQTVKQAQILASLQDEFEPVESMQL
ncbi:hypothetical protein L3Y34_018825 [Caenorhabditis briggsae]|uniref:Uncharacterized protein n=1 Tax=Caenorhabditis briggsae TaxID=6238 RepID=A0AAE9IVA8_CAEBR|nr:hypothetical protein L3Y34_018825 [Caenorhabditis briggsae]